jgi:hypothetical protein
MNIEALATRRKAITGLQRQLWDQTGGFVPADWTVTGSGQDYGEIWLRLRNTEGARAELVLTINGLF